MPKKGGSSTGTVGMRALSDLTASNRRPAGGVDLSAVVPTLTETMENLGAAAQAKILGEMIGGVFHGGGGGGDRQSIKDVTSALRDLNDISSSREETLRKRLADAEDRAHDGKLADVEREKVAVLRDKSMADVVMAMMEKSSSGGGGNEVMMLLLKSMIDQQTRLTEIMLQDIRDPKRSQASDQDDLLKRLGLEYLQGALQRNPREEYERERAYWSKQLEGGAAAGHDIQMFKVRKELELEERKWEREQQQREQEQQNRGELYKAMFASLAAIRGPQQQSPASSPVDTVENGSESAYRLECPSCHQPIVVAHLEPELTCPHCQVTLRQSTDSKPKAEMVM